MKTKYSNFVLNIIHRVMRSLKRTKGVVSIRKTRMRKFRKRNLKLSLMLKSFSIAYICLLITTISINDTNAFLNDTTESQAQFKAQWEEKKSPSKHGDWDKSSLKFVGQGGACSEIFATIKNGKNAMKEKIRYEVFFIEKGGPKTGSIEFEGESAPLNAGEEITLTYKAQKSGVYMFKAYQHVDHPGNGELWSKEINVSCDVPTKPKEKTTSIQTEENEESSPDTVNEEQGENTSSPVKHTEEENIEDKEITNENEQGSTSSEDNGANQVKDNPNQTVENTNTNDDQN